MNPIQGKVTRVAMVLALFCGLATAVAPCARAEKDLPVKRPASDYIDPEAQYPVDAYDPLEGFNRGVYKFNALLDRYVVLLVVRGYEFVAPPVVRKGVTNFFANLMETRNFANSLLQGKAEGCLNSVLRFGLNTTLGVGGLWDPATDAGFRRHAEDFGQTLGVWGLGPGPFLVLPLWGPSNLRDTGGLIADAALYSWWTGAIIDEIHDDGSTRSAIANGLMGLNAVNTRSNIKFRYYQTGSPFEYELVRFLTLKQRELEIQY